MRHEPCSCSCRFPPPSFKNKIDLFLDKRLKYISFGSSVILVSLTETALEEEMAKATKAAKVVKPPKNKSDIVEELLKSKTLKTKGLELSKKDAKLIVDELLGIVKTFTKKQGVRLVGFGSFSVQKRSARMGFNPATGEKIKIKAKKTVKFRPGKEFKEFI